MKDFIKKKKFVDYLIYYKLVTSVNFRVYLTRGKLRGCNTLWKNNCTANLSDLAVLVCYDFLWIRLEYIHNRDWNKKRRSVWQTNYCRCLTIFFFLLSLYFFFLILWTRAVTDFVRTSRTKLYNHWYEIR